MKFLSTAIASYRYFSSKTTTKYAKWTHTKNKNIKSSSQIGTLSPLPRKPLASDVTQKKNMIDDPKIPRRARIKWTDEQSQVLAAVSGGLSVFITGSAGTGKTELLQHIIKRLIKLHGRSRVFVTASTGVAACALKGQTLHSFAGIGLASTDREDLLHRVVSNRQAYRRWNRACALVIDEISMIDGEFLDILQYIAQHVRREEHGSETKTWGGLQLIVTGDFFQLPPVFNRNNSKGGKEFAFEANCWETSFDMQVQLTKIFRQSEAQLVMVLQNIRRGEIDPGDLELLQKCCSKTEPDSLAVQLYPRTKDVDRVNKKKMENLKEPTYVYRALDVGEDPWKRQLKQGIAPDELILSKGARVMLCKNLNPWRKLVNGATGTVMEFLGPDGVNVSDICEKEVLPLVKFDSGLELIISPETWVVMEGDKIVAKRKQMPLILAWALTIHKCQGMTLDNLHTNLSRAFGFGMVYVALSRVRSLEGLHLSGFKPSKIKAHPKVLEFYRRCFGEQDNQGKDDGVYKDKSRNTSAIHISNKTTCKESNMNPSIVLHCNPNSSLVNWYNIVTKRGWR